MTTVDSAVFYNDKETGDEVPVNRLLKEDFFPIPPAPPPPPPGTCLKADYEDCQPNCPDIRLFNIIRCLDAEGGGGGGGVPGGGGGGVGGNPTDVRPPYDAETPSGGGGGPGAGPPPLFGPPSLVLPETLAFMPMTLFEPDLPKPVAGGVSVVNVGNAFANLNGGITDWGAVTDPAKQAGIFQLVDDSYLRAFITLSIACRNKISTSFAHPLDVSLRIGLGLTRPPTLATTDLNDHTNWTIFNLKHQYRVTERVLNQATAVSFSWTIPSSVLKLAGIEPSTSTLTNEGMIVTIFAIAAEEENIFTETQTLTINSKVFMI